MRQWSTIMLLALSSYTSTTPQASNITNSNNIQISEDSNELARLEILVAGFKYLQTQGIETTNIPNGLPLDLNGFKRVSDLYGPRFHPIKKKWLNHSGIDFSGKTGTDVYSAADGIVTTCSRSRGYGKRITIDHGNGLTSIYAHLDDYTIKRGDKVSKGDVIGKLGNTGVSTGSHLHYEVRLDNVSINPVLLLSSDNNVSENELVKILNIQSNERLTNKENFYYRGSSNSTKPI